MSDQIQAKQANRWLNRAILAFLIFVVGLVSLVASGLFDPQPFGREQMVWVPGRVNIHAQSPTIQWLDPFISTFPYSVQLTARHENGESDIGYGLVIGNPTHHLVVAVSPTGYVSVWEDDGSEVVHHLTWQTWPHVRTGSEQNEIWLDHDGEQITVRLNREFLWSGLIPDIKNQIGHYTESFGAPSAVQFNSLGIWYEAP